MATLVLAGMPGSALRAQDAERGGALITARVGQSLVWTDDPDEVGPDGDGGIYSRTGLGLTFGSVTRNQSIEFDFTGALEYGAILDDTGLADPALRFDYSRRSKNAQLDVFAQGRSVELDESTGFEEIDLDDDGIAEAVTPITVSGGRREILRYGATVETGLEAPFGLVFDLNRTSSRYTNTSDLDLFDTTTTRADALARLRLGPRTTLRTSAGVTQYEAEDEEQTERDTTRFGIGASVLLDPNWTLDGDLTWTRIETQSTVENEVIEGAAVDLALTRTLPNGTLVARLASDLDQNGRRETIRLTRAMTLPSEADLSWTLGAGQTADGDILPVLGLSYGRALRTGRISADFSQQFQSDDDDTVLDTQLNASYQRELTRRTGMLIEVGVSDRTAQSGDADDRRRVRAGLDFNSALSEVASVSTGLNLVQTTIDSGGVSGDEDRFGFDVSYRHEVVRNLDLVASYDFSRLSGDDADSRNDSTITVGVERTFSLRP